MLQPQLMPYLSDCDDGLTNPRFSPHEKLPPSSGTAMESNRKSSPKLPPLKTSDSLLNGHAIMPSPAPMSGAQEPMRTDPPSRASTDPPRASYSSGASSALQVPASSHRRTSPKRYSHPPPPGWGIPIEPPSKAVAPPLQHRHTLEVPRLSTSRTSQDHYTPSSAQTEPAGLLNGKTSPTTPKERRRASLTLARRITKSLHSDQHLEDVPQDEDASRWAEHVRQKRVSRRRRKEEEDDDRVVVGTKVDQHHVNWETAYNMLTGIRFTVSRTNAKIRRGELTEAHFTAAHKFSFDITGNELTPSAKYDFKFKDYAPEVFRELRHIFRLDPADYLVSLTSKYILSELGSPGKSGSFFYFSRDYKYIIKTIHHAEHNLLRKVLRQYFDHVKRYPDTLLSQFYGLHRVKLPYGRKIHFVVMNNLFPPHRDIHRTFDLKGSTIGREFKEEELEKHPRATLKDLNWLRRNMHLEFGPGKKHRFIEQMENDVELLKRLKIMDYSLLVGIHDLERGNEENLRDKTLRVFQPHSEEDLDEPAATPAFALARTPSKLETVRKARELRQNLRTQRPVPIGSSTSTRMPDEMPDDLHQKGRNFLFYSDDGGFRATHEDDRPGEEIYYLGIIDCLTKYNFVKKGEHFFKGLTQPEDQISAVPPERYGARFVKFISSVTVPKELVTGEKELAAGANSPDRTRSTIDSTDGQGQTLPVVEEAPEGGTNGGRSTGNEKLTETSNRQDRESVPGSGRNDFEGGSDHEGEKGKEVVR